MKKYFFFIAALALTATACSENEETPAVELGQQTTRALKVTLPLDGTRVSSAKFRVLLFNGSGTQLVATIDDVLADTDANGNIANLHLNLTESHPALSGNKLIGRLVVMANCPTVSETPNAKELSELTYTMGDSDVPMYGAIDINLDLYNSYEVTAPAVELLRSAAMVTVELGQNLLDEGIRLSECYIPQEVNTTGYCLPSPSVITISKDYKDEAIFRPLSKTTAAGLALTSIDGGKSMNVMIPEVLNDGSLSMKLDFTCNGAPLTGEFANTIHFKDYAKNLPFNLVRNHHYIFTITALTTSIYVDAADSEDEETGDLTVLVKDWNHEEPETIVFN